MIFCGMFLSGKIESGTFKMYICSFHKKEEFKKLKIKMDSENKIKLNKIQKTSNRVKLERINSRTSKGIPMPVWQKQKTYSKRDIATNAWEVVASELHFEWYVLYYTNYIIRNLFRKIFSVLETKIASCQTLCRSPWSQQSKCYVTIITNLMQCDHQ